MAPVTAAHPSAGVSSVLPPSPRAKSNRSLTSRNFKRESNRLRTFANWPVTFLDGKELAKNGFFFTNINDVVKCAFCQTQIGFWEEGDDPKKDHLKLSPDCPFLKNEPCGNVAISEEGEEDEGGDQGEDEAMSQDVCGISSLQIRPFSEPERLNKSAISIDSTNLWKDFEELEVTDFYEPVAPNFATYESRLKTFDKWEAQDIQSPSRLAEAGFYYIGHEDNVLCFHCGGGLKNWEKGEDPWVEHARWFSKCRFILLQKGRGFVNEVALRKKAYLTAETAREIIEESKKSGEKSTRQVCESDPKPEAAEPSNGEKNPSSTPAPIPSVPCCSKTQKMPPQDGREIQLCRICYTRERGIVFLPCGHFVCCPQCTSSLTKCAVCREPFKATVRAYLC